MNISTMWLVILAGGTGTFLCRYSFFWLAGRKTLPSEWIKVLRFVPPAVLAALIVPSVVVPGLENGDSFINPRTLAALIATFVAWKTKGVMSTFIAGMGSLWALQALM